MTPEDILVKFTHTLDKFEPITRQPSDNNLTGLQEAVAPLLLQIPYDETGAVHNLIGLIWLEAAYVARYDEACPEPCGLGERLVVAGNVSSLQPNEANEVMYCARFVIRDLQQERRNGLLKSCQVGIGRLSINWLEVI